MLVTATGVPLLYLMKMNAYGLLREDKARRLVIRSEFIRIRNETGDKKCKIRKAVAARYGVTECQVQYAVDKYLKSLKKK